MEKLYPGETITDAENQIILKYQPEIVKHSLFLDGAGPIPSPILPDAAPPMGAKGVILLTNQVIPGVEIVT